jgi:hypothetical protein
VVNASTGHVGPEDFVETKLLRKKAWAGLFKFFEKFKIAPQEAELQLSKLQLKKKSPNHTSLNGSILGQKKADVYFVYIFQNLHTKL